MNAKVCRRELAARMAKRTGILKKDCERMIDAFVEEMVIQLKSGDGVHLPKLGKFEYYVRGETARLDGPNGEKVPVPPATRIKFLPCNDVKYGVKALDWEPHLSEYQKTESGWYKNYLKEREEGAENP